MAAMMAASKAVQRGDVRAVMRVDEMVVWMAVMKAANLVETKVV
jgi:hypothetical protein